MASGFLRQGTGAGVRRVIFFIAMSLPCTWAVADEAKDWLECSSLDAYASATQAGVFVDVQSIPADKTIAAIAACTRVILRGTEKSVNLARPYYDRGAAYQLKSDFDHAIADYSRALKLNPSYVEAYHARSVAYSNQGASARAIADLERIIQPIRMMRQHLPTEEHSTRRAESMIVLSRIMIMQSNLSLLPFPLSLAEGWLI
jgi:tetratricopeptide (TPR) repeat protein